jgi:hypothetical protein
MQPGGPLHVLALDDPELDPSIVDVTMRANQSAK